jgi:hypothetical protein
VGVKLIESSDYGEPWAEKMKDAGVIIESAPIAQYFENVFLADWNNKAKPFVAKGAAPPKPKKKRV